MQQNQTSTSSEALLKSYIFTGAHEQLITELDKDGAKQLRESLSRINDCIFFNPHIDLSDQVRIDLGEMRILCNQLQQIELALDLWGREARRK